MIEVTTENFEEIVLKSDKPVMVDMWAPWCNPCKMVTPILEAIATNNAETIKIVKCNVDENPEIAQKYNIRGIPTVLYFRDGNVVNSTVGAVSSAVYESQIKLLLS